ncbi:tRNA pseudouridine(13) synthase TruD [uncultured Methanolobus sp.]|uniref:tRNA pseudouridine(13) synthase TruD n=1 Tax=uncultured Methanolobus sp. TaxID=218300 RepID=UPI0029C67CFC|nr:tRNA pseudouridine(13) synthase TruD [uncultured Methanolobus sp.]
MQLKAIPSDFQVDEVYSPLMFSEEGTWRVYLLMKQKYNTMDALRILAKNSGIPLDKISYAGLKDRQAITRQLIAVEGRDISYDKAGLALQYVGRMDHPLSGKDIKGNRFRIVVRKVSRLQLKEFERSCEDVSLFGVINYFDSQRFGCLRNGQGFAMRYILLGQYKVAFRMIAASFSAEAEESRIKRIIHDSWGNWTYLARVLRAHHYGRCLAHLSRHPGDFKGALCLLPEFERTLPLFAYQSYLWNSAVSRFLEMNIQKDRLVAMDYVAGKLLFYDRLDEMKLEEFKNLSFPLPGHSLKKLQHPEQREAYEAVLEAEGISVYQLGMKTHGFYLKEEQRPLIVFPEHLRILEVSPDELSRENGMMKVVISFELPRGAYATLVIGRIFEAVACSVFGL